MEVLTDLEVPGYFSSQPAKCALLVGLLKTTVPMKAGLQRNALVGHAAPGHLFNRPDQLLRPGARPTSRFSRASRIHGSLVG